MSAAKMDVNWEIIPKSLTKSFQTLFPAYDEGLIRAEPGGYVMTAQYKEGAEKVYQMKPRKDDVWLCTFLKSGTTWVSELAWLLINNLDYETSAKEQLLTRTPYPEMIYYYPAKQRVHLGELPYVKSPEQIEALPSPRMLRPHLPFYLLPPTLLETSKCIYVARNPKDVIVSYFHHSQMLSIQKFTGTFEQFVECFMNDEILATPYFPHVLQAWKLRDHPNLHFMFYEDMKMDLKGEIRKLAAHLGKTLTEAEVDKLAIHLDIKNFEKNETTNNSIGNKIGVIEEGKKFVRKGIIGDWKNHFSPELNKRVDEWIAKNLAGTGLTFVTE